MKLDRCPTCGRRKTRSTEQNRRYFKLLTMFINKYRDKVGIKYPDKETEKKEYHEEFVRRFLGEEESISPAGVKRIRPIDTHNLPVDKFGEYMEQVEAHCAEHGVFLDS